MKFDLSALKKNISPRVAAQSVLVLSVAIGAGFFVQKMAGGKGAAPSEVAAAQVAPTDIVPLAAETTSGLPAAASVGGAVMGTPQTAEMAPQTLPAVDQAQIAMTTTTPAADLETPATPLAVVPELTVDLKPATPNTAVVPEPAVPATQIAQADCTPSLDLLAEDMGMIGLTLIAGCDLNQRVVLRHGGLSVTAITTATGALFASLPGMEKDAKVEVMFADGRTVQASIAIPDLNETRRFAVQWQADDAFQIHAFEGTVQYNSEGHISADAPHKPLIGQGNTGGFLTVIGDANVELPMLAQVYTFPMDAKIKPEVIVEAAVTPQTCGRELLGETLTSVGGEVYITDLTVAMPDCGAVGDYLVLKNLVPELNITASN